MRSGFLLLVLLLPAALPLVAAEAAPRLKDPKLRKAIDKAVSRGLTALKQQQAGGGAWTFDGDAGLGVGAAGKAANRDATGGLTALALYAISAAGTPASDPAIKRGLGWVAKNPRPFSKDGTFGTYSASLLVLALTRISPETHGKRIRALADLLVKAQLASGLWNYRLGPAAPGLARGLPGAGLSTAGDNSNTQFAVLALWAAQARAGVKVPKATWTKVRDHFGKTRLRGGTWGYRPSKTGRGTGIATKGRPAMFCAGVTSWLYAMAGMQGGTTSLQKALQKVRATRFAKDAKKVWAVSPVRTWDDLYLGWGVERMAAALDMDGAWYAAAAKALVVGQAPNGRWVPGTRGIAKTHGDSRHVYETALALLLLTRSTSGITGR